MNHHRLCYKEEAERSVQECEQWGIRKKQTYAFLTFRMTIITCAGITYLTLTSSKLTLIGVKANIAKLTITAKKDYG